MMILSENCTHIVQQYITSKNKKKIRIYRNSFQVPFCSFSGAQDRFGIGISSSC